MSLRINDTIPNLTVETDQGSFALHDWVGDSWAILFSHPKDFTPVCTTEFGAVAQLADEWAKRGTKVIGVSVDGVEDHKKWKSDIETVGGAAAGFRLLRIPALRCPKRSTCCRQRHICPMAVRLRIARPCGLCLSLGQTNN